MKTSLLEKLLGFYEEEPGDPFNAYALALECQKHDAGEAEKYFNLLLNHHPEYLPTYYHAAQFFSVQEPEKAAAIFEKGIDLAIRQRNVKAQQELSRAFRTFQDEQMDW